MFTFRHAENLLEILSRYTDSYQEISLPGVTKTSVSIMTSRKPIKKC